MFVKLYVDLRNVFFMIQPLLTAASDESTDSP